MLQPKQLQLYASLALNMVAIAIIFLDERKCAGDRINHQNVAVSIGEHPTPKKTQLRSVEIASNVGEDISKIDIYSTTKIVKCNPDRTEVSLYSLLYWDQNTEGKQYGCKAAEMLDWARSLRSKEKRYFSQNGEDGVVDEIFSKIGEKSRFFVEFGVQDAKICNTRYFREKGWKGVMFDNNHNNSAIGLFQTAVWVDNVVQLFKQHGVPQVFDLLSVDTDFSDFWNLREIMLAGYRPRVVIVEVNVASGPYASFTIPKKEAEKHGMFLGVRWFGGSVLAYSKLMHKFGYQLLHVETMVINAIFVKSTEINNIDLARTLWQRVQFDATKALRPTAAHPPDSKNRPFEHICEEYPCNSSDDW